MYVSSKNLVLGWSVWSVSNKSFVNIYIRPILFGTHTVCIPLTDSNCKFVISGHQ